MHSNIWFVYSHLDFPFSTTVGVENSDGTIGDSYYFNGAGTAPVIGVDLKVVATFGDDPAIATNDDDRKFADLNLCPECWAEILKEDIMYGNCGICLAKIPDDIMSAATFI